MGRLLSGKPTQLFIDGARNARAFVTNYLVAHGRAGALRPSPTGWFQSGKICKIGAAGFVEVWCCGVIVDIIVWLVCRKILGVAPENLQNSTRCFLVFLLKSLVLVGCQLFRVLHAKS